MNITKIIIFQLMFVFLFLSYTDQSAIDLSTDRSLSIGVDLTSLNIVLPNNWSIDKINNNIYNYLDENGKQIGFITAIEYKKIFDLLTQKPNHSSITYDEYIDIPLGKCRLLTLDADNGTAASGIKGTHDVYYASIPIKEKGIYILSFTKNDKSVKSKQQFINILSKLSLKY